MSKKRRLPSKAKRRISYRWCLHCERAYPAGHHRRGPDGALLCPYEDCDGGALGDSFDWERIREGHPEYPAVPEMGKVYPLY